MRPVFGFDRGSVSAASKLSLLAPAEHGAVPFPFTLRRSFFAAPAASLGRFAGLFFGRHRSKRYARTFDGATLLLLIVERALMTTQMGREWFAALFAGAKEVGRQSQIGLLRGRLVGRRRFDGT